MRYHWEKSPVEMNLEERKADIIRHSFITPADADYLTARWSYLFNQSHVFHWSVGQAMEKYMKAILLCNGESSKKYSHNLTKLFDEVLKFDMAGRLSRDVQIPYDIAPFEKRYQGKSLASFIKLIEDFGSADNRYGSIGIQITLPILDVVDYLCMTFRKILKEKEYFHKGKYFCEGKLDKEELTDVPKWFLNTSFRLERVYLKGLYGSPTWEKSELFDTFKDKNFSFFPDTLAGDHDYSALNIMQSPIENHLVRFWKLSKQDQKMLTESEIKNSEQIVPELRSWVKDNIYLSSNDLKKLKFNNSQ